MQSQAQMFSVTFPSKVDFHFEEKTNKQTKKPQHIKKNNNNNKKTQDLAHMFQSI